MFSSLRNLVNSGGGERAAAKKVDTTLTTLLLEWVQATPEVKFRAGCLMIELLRRIIPDIDFSKNLYAQFTPFRRNWEHEFLSRLGLELHDTSMAAESVEPALHLASSITSQFLLLWSLSIRSEDARLKRDLGAIYATHIRTTNDFIQNALFVIVVGGIAPSAEVAAALLPPE